MMNKRCVAPDFRNNFTSCEPVQACWMLLPRGTLILFIGGGREKTFFS